MPSVQEFQESAAAKFSVGFLLISSWLLPFYAQQMNLKTTICMQASDMLRDAPEFIFGAVTESGPDYPLAKYGCSMGAAAFCLLSYLAFGKLTTQSSKGMSIFGSVMVAAASTLCCGAITLIMIFNTVFIPKDREGRTVEQLQDAYEAYKNCFIALGFFQTFAQITLIPALLYLTPQRRCCTIVGCGIFVKFAFDCVLRLIFALLMKSGPMEDLNSFTPKPYVIALTAVSIACALAAILSLVLGGVFKVEGSQASDGKSIISIFGEMKLSLIAGSLLLLGGQIYYVFLPFLNLNFAVVIASVLCGILVGLIYDGVCLGCVCCVRSNDLPSDGVATLSSVISIAVPNLIAFTVMTGISAFMGFAFMAMASDNPEDPSDMSKRAVLFVVLILFAGFCIIPMIYSYLAVPISVYLHPAAQRSGKMNSVVGAAYSFMMFCGTLSRLVYQVVSENFLKKIEISLIQPWSVFDDLAKKFMLLFAIGTLIAALSAGVATYLYSKEKRLASGESKRGEESKPLVSSQKN